MRLKLKMNFFDSLLLSLFSQWMISSSLISKLNLNSILNHRKSILVRQSRILNSSSLTFITRLHSTSIMSTNTTTSSRGRGRGGRTRGRGRGKSVTNGSNRSTSTMAAANQEAQVESDNEPSSGVTTPSSYLSTTTFSSLSQQIDSRILSSIPQSFKFMTEVQAKTLHPALSGVDLLAQAKTGTGKTLAFLIPSIESICRSQTLPQMGLISVLCLSPTRELALQIKQEAKMLLAGMNGALDVQCCVGGTNVSSRRCQMSEKSM